MLSLGLQILDCELVCLPPNKVSDTVTKLSLQERLKSFMFLHPTSEAIWYDFKDNLFFSMEHYRPLGSRDQTFGNTQVMSDGSIGVNGKDHNFSCHKNLFYSSPYGKKYIDTINTLLGSTIKYDMKNCHDILIRDDKLKKKYQGSSLLIVGGGPSTNMVDFKNIEYDYMWTCNNFFKNDKLREMKVDMSVFAPNIQLLDDKEFVDYVENSDTTICFETERGDHMKDWLSMTSFMKKYPDRYTIYGTRYRSNLGITTRQIIYAIYMGAKKLYIAGLDGMSQKSNTHAFEKTKENVPWFQKFGEGFQNRQFISFWEYILKLQQKHNFEIYNLGEIYDGNISKHIITEMEI